MEKSRRGKGNLEDSGHFDKLQVLQEAKRCFGTTTLKPRKQVDVLTRCIFILLKGEDLSSTEATDLFLHITRLFQYKNKDATLKRLTYIGIKVLSKQAENVYVVTSSLMNDVNSTRDDPAIRASALRALCQISDVTTLITIESYLRQSVVDKHSVLSSAALSSMIRIAQVNEEIVRKYANEIEEALKSDSPMVQYHALALRYTSCKNDRLATSRLISHCINQGIKSPLATCLLLRIIANYINDSPKSDDFKKYLSYVRECMNHKSEMVEYEASNTMISVTKDSSKIAPAISHLRNFLSSPKPALRFASLRLLNELAATSSADIRFWSIHRIGTLCKLHLLNKRYRPGDQIIGILDFTDSSIACAKYTCVLQCEETQQFEFKQEFSLGLKQNDLVITIPPIDTQASILHCVLSFLFYIADKNYPKTLFEDRAGTIELGPSELETKIFSCDFPIAIYTVS